MTLKAPTARFPGPLRRAAVLAGAVVLIAALALYLLTLDNGLRLDELKGGDLITHQYAQVEGRPSNAPGYPLYTMGGWLWFRLGKATLSPLFSPLEVLSLYSTIWAIGSLALLYLLALEFGGGHWPLAVAATAFYSVTYFFWYYAVSTEQYTSAVMQTLLLLLLALRWQRRRRDRYLYWMAFVAGTCLANLVTVALIFPGLLWFVLSREPGLLRRRDTLLRLAGVGLLPLLAYAYVYVRGAQHPEWRGEGEWSSTLTWFLSFVGTSQGRQEMTLSLFPVDLTYLRLVPGELTWPVLLAGLIGLALLERHHAVLAIVTLVAYLAFSYVDRYGNWFQVVMPAYPIVVLGCVRLAGWLADRGGGRSLLVVALAGVLLAATGERLLTNLPRADQRNHADDVGLCSGAAILMDLAGERAPVVVATYDEQVSLQYLNAVYGLGSDVRAVPASEVGSGARYLTRAALPLAQPLPASWAHPQALGTAVLAMDSGVSASPGAPTLLGPLDVSVASWEVRPQSGACGGDVALVRTRWSVRQTVAFEFVVSARPLVRGLPVEGPDGPVQDDHPPLWGAIAVTSWVPGQIWLDAYAFPVPGALPDGLRLILYRATSGGTETLWTADLALPAPSAPRGS